MAELEIRIVGLIERLGRDLRGPELRVIRLEIERGGLIVLIDLLRRLV